MSTWEGKSRGNVLGYRIFAFLLKNFGLSPAYLLLRFVAFYFFLSSPSAFRANYYYFRKILGYGTLKSIIGIYKNFYVFGQTIIDKVVLFAGFPNRFTYHFDGRENLVKIAADKQGGILISGHVGNWDIAGHFLREIDAVINIVMFDAEREKIKEYLDKMEVRKTIRIITVKEDMSHLFEISRAIADKELVCMHGDRFVKGSKTVTCDFFGKPAEFPKGPFQLATRMKVPYIFVFGLKETKTHYHLYATPGKINQGGIDAMVKEYAETLEKMILKYPYQWFNFYQFWKKEN